ncbi:hypothetical protein EDD40_7415 [Saccharothrix texasensis]|uniref:Uncharacterized protein n=1 Tax=Saccharothrix texasensis TaxID=103734 RepID=A0A3N1HHC8_9PSEU|nr:hypothetical protein EDD40_7415 [Saccharothrix texasensis]
MNEAEKYFYQQKRDYRRETLPLGAVECGSMTFKTSNGSRFAPTAPPTGSSRCRPANRTRDHASRSPATRLPGPTRPAAGFRLRTPHRVRQTPRAEAASVLKQQRGTDQLWRWPDTTALGHRRPTRAPTPDRPPDQPTGRIRVGEQPTNRHPRIVDPPTATERRRHHHDLPAAHRGPGPITTRHDCRVAEFALHPLCRLREFGCPQHAFPEAVPTRDASSRLQQHRVGCWSEESSAYGHSGDLDTDQSVEGIG